MFHVGQLVICIRDDWSLPLLFNEKLPIKGLVYTVRSIHCIKIQSLEIEVDTIRLEEIVNPVHPYKDGDTEMSWGISAFRPLDNTKIEVFEAMLNDTKISA